MIECLNCGWVGKSNQTTENGCPKCGSDDLEISQNYEEGEDEFLLEELDNLIKNK